MRMYLNRRRFPEGEALLAQHGEFKVKAFTYSTGIEAVRVENRRGGFTLLPWMGQIVWRCDFDGRELAMKSIYDEPRRCRDTFGESYGVFLMHCGLTAMGNPTPADTHTGHGELPIAVYDEAWVDFGSDRRGDWVAVGGTYRHRRAFDCSYDFTPSVRLYAGEAKLAIEAAAVNLKDLPLEYYYLCHVNHLPVDGSKIAESPLAKAPIINHEVPEGYRADWAAATNAFLDRLDGDFRIQSTVGAKGESYRPEIVNCYFHRPDRTGRATVAQLYPHGGGVFVTYFPKELPYATRWIARTEDEDAMGMCLPATAEHKGRLFCQAHKEQRVLKSGGKFAFHVETGLLTKAEAEAVRKALAK